MTSGSHFWPCTGSSRTGLSNGVWNLEIGVVVWEISGWPLPPPPPSRTYYHPDPSGARVYITPNGTSCICIPQLDRAAIWLERGPGRAFAKCLLNFGLRPDRPAGIRHRQPMGEPTAAQDSGVWRHTTAERTVVCLVATRGLIRCPVGAIFRIPEILWFLYHYHSLRGILTEME